MQNIYKYGFWFFILVILALFNYIRMGRNYYEKDIKMVQEILDKRNQSLLMSNIDRNRILPEIDGANIITNTVSKNIIKDSTYLVILLSRATCNKCQEKELQRLQANIDKLKQKGISIIGITTEAHIGDVALQRKMGKVKFPLYWVDDKLFKEKLSFDENYPQILLVKDRIVISAFQPVPLDDKFSETYYKHIIEKY